MTSLSELLWYVLPIAVKSIEDDGASRLNIRCCPDPLQQILERSGGLDAHQQDVAFFAGHRMTRLDLRDVFQAGGRIIGLRRIQRGDGNERRQQMPTASGLIRAEYPDTTPRDSSRRTRDWTADTDSPALDASSASVARPSATSSRIRIRSISSSVSPMAGDYRSDGSA